MHHRNCLPNNRLGMLAIGPVPQKYDLSSQEPANPLNAQQFSQLPVFLTVRFLKSHLDSRA